MSKGKLNGYILTRAWFDYAFDNPEKYNPTDGYLYLFFIEVANRSKWASKFQISATDAMQALGICTYNTYRKSFDKLVKDGWITVISQAKNQWQKTVIALSKNNTADDSALDRADNKAPTTPPNSAPNNSSATILKTFKPLNNKTIKEKENARPKVDSNKRDSVKTEKEKAPPVAPLPPELVRLNNWLKENAPRVLQMSEQITPDQYAKLFSHYHETEILSIFQAMHNTKPLLTKYTSAYYTADKWLKMDRERKPQGQAQPAKSKVTSNIEKVNSYVDRNSQ